MSANTLTQSNGLNTENAGDRRRTSASGREFIYCLSGKRAMITKVSRPILFLMLITALNSLLVMPLVTGPVSDVGARSRVAHWLWTGDKITPQQSPPPSDDPN